MKNSPLESDIELSSKDSFWSLAWLLIGVSVVGCNSLALSPILSDLSVAFRQDPSVVARAAGAYGGATAFASFFIARYSENIGMRKMLRFGCIFLSIGIGSCAFANNWVMLTISQAIAGLGAGVMIPAIYAMASSIAPKGRESVYVGRAITGWSMAMVLGIPFAAFIADIWGWRYSYIIMASLSLCALLGFAKLPAHKRKEKTKTLSSLQVLKIPDVFIVLSICLLFMLSFYGVYIFIGDYAREVLSISTSAAGLLVMAYGIGFALGSFGDPLIDRFGPKKLIKFILLTIAAIYASMSVLTHSVVTLLIVCCAWGFANHFGLNSILVILNTSDPNNKAAIMGIYTTVTYLATLLATIIFGYLYRHFDFTSLLALATINCLIAALFAALKLENPKLN